MKVIFFIVIPAAVFHGIVPCVALFVFLFIAQQTSSSYPSPVIASKAKQEKDGASLQIQTSYLP
jgi:hypothetical protein